MKKQFKPIAMRCTQEQFEAIKPKLEGCMVSSIGSFDKEPYLINYRFGEKNNVTNYLNINNSIQVFEEWNEEIFLKSCGIETKKETLQDKVKRLEKELEQAKQELEESKPKIGDVAVVDNGEYKAIVVLNNHQVNIFKDAVTLPTELQEQLRPYLSVESVNEDSFVLPEKWCVKHSDESLEWIRENAEENGDFIRENNYYMYPCDDSCNIYTRHCPKGYTEITIEQFKKYVLNK